MTNPIYDCVINKKTTNKPIWFMRQAGRYLPEFRKIKKLNPNFINLCLNEKLSSEITIQPLKRFNLSAATIFFRYFNGSLWIKSKSEFYKKLRSSVRRN